MREWSYFTWSQFPLYKCIIVLLLLNRTWGIINNLYPIIIMMRESWTILVKKSTETQRNKDIIFDSFSPIF